MRRYNKSGVFKNIKKKSKKEQRAIRAKYMRERRHAARNEFNRQKNSWANVKKSLYARALQLDKVSVSSGAKLRQEIKDIEELNLNSANVRSDRGKEPLNKKYTNDAYHSLSIWGKDTLKNRHEFNVKDAKNNVTMTAAILSGIRAEKNTKGNVRADLSNATAEQKRNYYNARRSVINGKKGIFTDVRNTFYENYYKNLGGYDSGQIVEAISDVLDRGSFDNNNAGWTDASKEIAELLDL